MIIRESLSFHRASSQREIKSKLLGFRPGQVLAVDDPVPNQGNNQRYIYVFAGYSENPLIPEDKDWNLRALSFGFLAGNPLYCHLSFHTSNIILKHKDSLRDLTDKEAELVKKALIKQSKYVKKAEEIIGSPVFV